MLKGCRGVTAVSVLLLFAIVSGCGRKTDLVPPQRLVPAPIADLRYSLDEKGVTLEWSYPTELENGDELQAIDSFEVDRAAILEKEYCDGCPIFYDEPQEIEGGTLPGPGETRIAEFTETYLQSGYRYFYRVRSRAGWWYPSRNSNVVTFVWREPPEVTRGLKVTAGDGMLTLNWEPVKFDIRGAALASSPFYRVYRREGNDNFSARGETVPGPEFVDSGLQNDMHYSYKVQALVKYGDTLQAGGFSQVVAGVPFDLSPPSVPMHLVAAAIPGGVKLAWQAVIGDDDLAGYRIYRREEQSAKAVLIAETERDTNQYVDRLMVSGKIWYYSVTSIDKAKPANESLPSQEVAVDLR